MCRSLGSLLFVLLLPVMFLQAYADQFIPTTPTASTATASKRIASKRIASKRIASKRIVSINLCFDALLIKLVEAERIKSLYYLSADPQFSSVSEQAKHFHLHHGLAEEIVPLNPDLVLAGDFTSADVKTILKQLGFRVEVLSLPRTLDDISAHIRQFGLLTHAEVAAEKMAQTLEQKLAQQDAARNEATGKDATPIPAFWYSSNGVVVGSDTLENELMTRAGFHNLALDKNISGFKQIDLETLMLAHPRVLIVEASDVQAFSLAQEYLQHPALRKNNLSIIQLPTTLSCIAPVVVDAIEELMQQRRLLAH
jgi:iron complex transport system substrate-binding protein